jgi:hypothetical protein
LVVAALELVDVDADLFHYRVSQILHVWHHSLAVHAAVVVQVLSNEMEPIRVTILSDWCSWQPRFELMLGLLRKVARSELFQYDYVIDEMISNVFRGGDTL